MSKLYIIGGPNGAGKTTASMEYLKSDLDCLEFVNADNIAVGISPFQPEKVAVTAGKIMLNRINELIESNVNFAIESTLSSKLLLDKIRKAKANNYEVILLFYWLSSVEIAIERVKSRVLSGGHDIPKSDIIRRYQRGLDNLLSIYMIAVDYCVIIDNSELLPDIIAESSDNNLLIRNIFKWDKIRGKNGQQI